MIQGVDISKWQGTVDWTKIISQGAKFVILKATEASGYKDPKFIEYYNAAKDVGLIVGAYHFFRATVTGEAQAQNVETTLTAYPLDMPVMLDVELFDNVDPPLVTSRLQRLVYELQGYQGYPYPGIYTSYGLWNSHVLAWSGWRNSPLWVAHWNATRPTLPRDWTEYLIWQYKLDTGSVWGVQSAKIDLDQWNENKPFPNDTPPPPPPPPPPPTDTISASLRVNINGITYTGETDLYEEE